MITSPTPTKNHSLMHNDTRGGQGFPVSFTIRDDDTGESVTVSRADMLSIALSVISDLRPIVKVG